MAQSGIPLYRVPAHAAPRAGCRWSLASAGNTRRIHAVLLAGRLYDHPRLDALRAYARAQARSPAVMERLLWGFITSPVSAEL